MTRTRTWRRSRLLAGALSLTMIAAACGGRDSEAKGGDSGDEGGSSGTEVAGGQSLVDTSIPETDLFAGVPGRVVAAAPVGVTEGRR